jgi:hypothetical protein
MSEPAKSLQLIAITPGGRERPSTGPLEAENRTLRARVEFLEKENARLSAELERVGQKIADREAPL